MAATPTAIDGGHVIVAHLELIHDDCYNHVDKIAQVDAVVFDPPYGIGADSMGLGNGKKEFHRAGFDNERPDIRPFIDHDKPLCVFGGNYFTDILPPTNQWLVWHKKISGVSFSEAELAWTNYSPNVRSYHRHWSGEEKRHPTQKPLSVMIWVLSLLPPEVETIFDPFMGAGTTGVACVQMGLGFIGCEIVDEYFEVAQDRIAAAAAQATMFDIVR